MITIGTILTIFALVSPEWATPINTLLLGVLMLANHRFSRRSRSDHARLARKVEAVHSDVSSAAAAALSAAQAAAQAAVVSSDTARIARDIGAAVRHTELPAPE